MGIGTRLVEGAKAWNRRRQLRRGVRKSLYENAERGMSDARKAKMQREGGWFDRAQAQEARRAKRRVFWREDAGKLFGGLNNDAKNLIGRPVARKIAKKAHIYTGTRFRRSRELFNRENRVFVEGMKKRRRRHIRHEGPTLI